MTNDREHEEVAGWQRRGGDLYTLQERARRSAGKARAAWERMLQNENAEWLRQPQQQPQPPPPPPGPAATCLDATGAATDGKGRSGDGKGCDV